MQIGGKILNEEFEINKSASWIEISEAALNNNILSIKKLLGGEKFGVVLKANAYGHGLSQVATAIGKCVDVVFVIDTKDGVELRKILAELNINLRIVVIGAVSEFDLHLIVEHNLEVAVSDDSWQEKIEILKTLKKKIRVHVFIETGLNREGFSALEIESRYGFLKLHRKLFEVVAVFSHFANTEDVTEQKYALLQIQNFEFGVKKITEWLNINYELEKHFAASAAALILAQSRFSLVRVGIALYGIWPSSETRMSVHLNCARTPQVEPVGLVPALSWKCKSQVVKFVSKGSYVGYGCSYKCPVDTLIAVFPVGYFDGYSRAMSGKAHVLVNGIRCPIIGRIMMNHIVADVTDVPSASNFKELEAVLIGGATNILSDISAENEKLTVETLANWAQTIPYEIVARIPAHVQRKLVC
jgi:alanine racemase